GATTSALSLASVQRADVGIYHVRVKNIHGATASDRVQLQIELTMGEPITHREEATDVFISLTNAVRAFTPPPTVIFHGAPLLFSTYNATAQSWETRCSVPPSHSMWVLYYSPRAETVRISTEGSNFDTVLGIYSWDGVYNH